MKFNKVMNGISGLALLALAATAFAQDRTTQTTDANGNALIVHSGQPAPVSYGPAPAFAQLDANRDGRISRDEAGTYIPLLNDFDYLAHGASSISRRQFENWNATQNRQ